MSNDRDEANEALTQMLDGLNTLKRIFRRKGGIIAERARMYPLGQIAMALSSDHEYIGECMFNVKELIEDAFGDEDDDHQDEPCGGCELCGDLTTRDAV